MNAPATPSPRLFLLLTLALATTGRAGEPIPMTGNVPAFWKPFDDAMLAILAESKASAGTLAVSFEGKLLLERGYGWSDKDRTRSTEPGTPMRIASVSKPITGAAVKKLIAAGKFTYETTFFDSLGFQPPGGKLGDPRVRTITIKQLLEHRGGWDRAKFGDPMFMMPKVRAELQLGRAPAAADVVRWMLGQPLQFDPGSTSVYSNFGYCVLGRVIEKASGQTYEQYVSETILKPLGMSNTFLSRSAAKDRDEREVWYPCKDDEFSIEVMDAHGGWTCSAADLCRFMDAYWINGEPRKKGQKANWIFFGSLPGTTSMAMQRGDGVNVAVLVNNRAGGDKLLGKIRQLTEDAAKQMNPWPP
ncbi:MAG TPA: serine hydrolase domain-containing protein [Planctomycetota bacterium]|jgi:CubicO group peptidase (beta-lactamase class C family)